MQRNVHVFSNDFYYEHTPIILLYEFDLYNFTMQLGTCMHALGEFNHLELCTCMHWGNHLELGTCMHACTRGVQPSRTWHMQSLGVFNHLKLKTCMHEWGSCTMTSPLAQHGEVTIIILKRETNRTDEIAKYIDFCRQKIMPADLFVFLS